MTGTSGTNNTAGTVLWYRMRALLGILALFLAVHQAFAQAPADRVLIANVYIVGNRTIPTDKVMAYIHSKPGSEYSYSHVQDDVSRLATAHIFKYIRVKTDPTTDGRMNVYFEVQEHPNIVKEVIYKHAKHVNLKELEDLTRVQRGMPLDKTLNQLACYEIQEHLRKQGYLLANVTLEYGWDETHDKVVFNITEGQMLRVRRVDFVGQNELATSERLRTQTDTSRAFLGAFGGKYIPAMVDSDVLKLEEYYRANGYLNVHVAREIKLSDDLKFVDITFHVHEGTRYRVQEWTIEGTKNFPREQLASICTIKKGDYYNDGVLTKDVNYITAYTGWRGYQTDVKKVVTEVPGASDLVRVQYVVEEKPPARVGEVIIVGNTVTQDRIIRRVLNIFPGQLLQYPETKIAENSLARLNIFETNPELGIRPTVTVLDSPGEFKDVLVKVQETRTGSLMLGAGINSDNGVVGSIVLNERNFDIFRFPTSFADIWEGTAWRGAGQELRLEAVPGTQVQRYSATIREPFLFDQPYSLSVSAYYRDRIFDEYTENRYGGQFTLGHQFTKEWSAALKLRIEEVGVYDIAYGAPPAYTSVYGQHFQVAPGFSIIYDNRDSFLRPTEGHKIQFDYEQVLGAFNFPIFNLEGTQYFTTWQRPDGSGKHVVMLRSQVSWEGSNAPVYERFFGGGYSSIRGFEFRGVGPNTNGFMTGGNFQWINTLEYQIPIRANDQLYFVTFLDSGTVDNSVTLNEYRVSAGFGLRITVPMLGPVPIALDFGFPITKSGTDRTQLFSFWIGMYR
jgi:outer membrane protein assembly complex protein YaeT